MLGTEENKLGQLDVPEVTFMRMDDSPEARTIGNGLIQDGEAYYDRLAGLRQRRMRNIDYVQGRQWSDQVIDPDNPDGPMITEEELIIRQGRTPMINNQMIQIMKNIAGQFRDNDYKPEVMARRPEDRGKTKMITNALQSIYEINELKEVDAQAFLEFAASGIFCQKQTWDRFPEMDQFDVLNENMELPQFCFNTEVRDVRMRDLRFFCHIIDAPIESLLNGFCKNREEREWMLESYKESNLGDAATFSEDWDDSRIQEKTFTTPHQNNLARVFEFWRREEKMKVMVHDTLHGDLYQHPVPDIDVAIELIKEENTRRIKEFEMQLAEQAMQEGIVPIVNGEKDRQMIRALGGDDQDFEEAQVIWAQYIIENGIQELPLLEYDVQPELVWMYYFVTTNGSIIDSGESPYEHQGLPYTLRLFPMLNGQVMPFVEDVIDQQRQINRLLSQLDFSLSTSAKGLLMVAEEHIPKGWDEDRYAGQYSKAGGMIVMKGDAIQKFGFPQQVTSSAIPVGAFQMLQVQMDLFQQISGITGAIQGHQADSGTPASRYQQEAANSTIATKHMFEFFFSARKQRDYMNVKLLQQFYNEDRYVNVSGKEDYDEAAIYKPSVAKDVPVKLVVTKSANAPVYRAVMDNYLMEFLQGGMIDLGLFLENTSLPFAQSLKQQIEQRQQAMQDQLAQMTPEQQAEMQQQG